MNTGKIFDRIMLITINVVLLTLTLYAGSYTPNISLYKPSQGETDWATSINTNFDTIDTEVNKKLETENLNTEAEIEAISSTSYLSTSDSTWTGSANFTGITNFSNGITLMPSGSTLPGTCAANEFFNLTSGSSGERLYLCESLNTWVKQAGGAGGSSGFDSITTGTNTSATLTVGTGGNLTFSGTGIVNASRFLGVTTIDANEFGYLNGVTSGLQAQIDGKQATDTDLDDLADGILTNAKVAVNAGDGYTNYGGVTDDTIDELFAAIDTSWPSGGVTTFDTITTGSNTAATMTVGTGALLLYSGTGIIDANRFLGVTTIDATEFGYLNGVTSSIQTQIDGKQTTDADLTDLADGSLTNSKLGVITGDNYSNFGSATDDTVDELVNAIDASWPAGSTTTFDYSLVNPTSTTDFFIKKSLNNNIQITSIEASCVGGTSLIGTLYECQTDGVNCVPIDSEWTISTGTEFTDSSFADDQLNQNDELRWQTTSVNGTVNDCGFEVTYQNASTPEVSVSDDFAGTLANWTQDYGSWSIISGELDQATTGVVGYTRYNTQASTINQQSCVVLDDLGSGGTSRSASLIFRDTNGTGEKYRLRAKFTSNELTWSRITGNTWGEDIQIASYTATVDDTLCARIYGTGNDTVIEAWINPGAEPWGTPDYTLTSNPVTPVDTGFYGGLNIYHSGVTTKPKLDDFSFGDI